MSNATKMHLFAANLVVVGIDDNSNADYSGRIWNKFHKEPRHFVNLVDMIQKIDDFLDELDFPQRAMEQRSFTQDGMKEDVRDRRMQKGFVVEEIDQNRGTQGTFIVQVKYRQNSTWQGQVNWADKNKTVYFRSALELIKLIDNALGEEAGSAFDAQEQEAAEQNPETSETTE